MKTDDSTPALAVADANEEPQVSRAKIELPTDRLWDVHQAAAFLGRSTSWVYKESSCGRLPKARGLAWGLKFVPDDLKAFARGEQPPAAVPIRRRTV